jgi:methylthioribose-1-phosphate isomerase
MKIKGRHFETIWLKPEDPTVIQVIDQRYLPFNFIIEDLYTVEDVYFAIKEMHIRGAPLIGVAAAFGIYLALLKYDGKESINKYIGEKAQFLKSSRPTAINIAYCVDKVANVISPDVSLSVNLQIVLQEVLSLMNRERENCKKIGEHGVKLIEEIYQKKEFKTVNILTHCNAGWLACIDYGTATAPIYFAFDKGIPVHVWVDETRPRNQGSRLTAWELHQHGVPYTLIADNTGGHLMQHGLVDMVLVGSDRTTIRGDVANKIGTYLKALAAYDNNIPFYAALPSSSIDWCATDGITDIPIEERDGKELLYGETYLNGELRQFAIAMKESPVSNYAFDVTPSRLVTALITERGVCKAEKNSIFDLYPEKKPN